MPGDRDQLLGAVFEAVRAGIVVVDDSRIVEVNAAVTELTGFARDDLIGAELPFPFFAPESGESMAAFIRELRDDESSETELALVRPDGSSFAAQVIGSRTLRGDGRAAVVLTIWDVSAYRERERRLKELAATDDLTGLLNKRSFQVSLAGEMARARRSNGLVALAILDLDGFKQVNDRRGHPAGDRVLAEAAGRLGALVRAGEHLARVGGDEFGWILPGADAEGATSAVSRARGAIMGEDFPAGAGRLSLSAGVCIADGAVDPIEVYRRADRALYRAKDSDGESIIVV